MSDTQDFEYDVFLSHNQADKPRVRRLAERLRAAGLRVWFDEWVIQPGGSPRPSDGRGVRGEGLAIERGLEASRTLVLCLSPAALGSDWVGLERSTVLFRDPPNAGRRFIPLLLADCKLPDTLRPGDLCRSLFRYSSPPPVPEKAGCIRQRNQILQDPRQFAVV